MHISQPEKLERLGQWMNRENERPLLGFTYEEIFPLHAYRKGSKKLPQTDVSPQDIVLDDYLADFDRLYNLHNNASGDMLWSGAPFWGIPWLEASLGCEISTDFTIGSMRAKTPVGFSENPEIPEFSQENPWVRKMLEFIEALELRSTGRFGIGVTLMRGISDLLSTLYGAEIFLIRMCENPKQVHEIIQKLTDYWISFGDCLLDTLKPFHGGTGVFLYGLWCPGKTIWLQEDAAALLSPQLYEEFIYPADCRIAEAFEHTVIHLHPSQFIPIDFILKSNIDAIELNVDKSGPSVKQLQKEYIKILSSKPLLIWGHLNENDMLFLLKNLPHKGLAINIACSSQEEGRHLWNVFQNCDMNVSKRM